MWLEEAIKLLNGTLDGLFPKEENRLDWKEALSSNNERFAQHLSAFANYPGGGYLVFGVKSTGQSMRDVKESECHKVISKISNLARIAVEPVAQVDHKLAAFRGKSILFVHVKESIKKPVHLSGKGKSIEDSYVRSGGETRKMSEDEIRESIVNSGHLNIEKLPALMRITEARLPELLNLEPYFSLIKRQGGMIEPQIEILKKRKIIESSEGNFFNITNLGMLVCAKDFSLFDKGFLSVRVIGYKDQSKLHAQTEKIFKSGYATTLDEIVLYIDSLLPHSEVIQDALRISESLYPKETIRELLANAAIHQMLNRSSGNIFVAFTSNSIGISVFFPPSPKYPNNVRNTKYGSSV